MFRARLILQKERGADNTVKDAKERRLDRRYSAIDSITDHPVPPLQDTYTLTHQLTGNGNPQAAR
ncbi:MAG: hypothetical protein U0931_14055 [Vulcanimicrobiota bacterium]